VLHAHFDAESTADGQTVFGPTGRLENGQRLALLDQLRSWCADSRTKITIKPVIDLTKPLSAPGYAIPDRIREHVILRDRTCVFPWCTRPARGCDIDHIDAYDHQADAEGRPQPGPTSTDNLAALCRFHHRLKTHSRWRYAMMVEPGAYVWTSPHGHHFTRDRTGSSPLTPPDLDRTGFRDRRQGAFLNQRRSPGTPSDHDPAPHPATRRMAGSTRHVASRP
jgi:hypothetical protein